SWRIYCDPLPMCRSQASSMPPGCVTTSRTSSPPTGSWKTPSEESCRPTRSSSPICCTVTTTCTPPTTRSTPAWHSTCPPCCSAGSPAGQDLQRDPDLLVLDRVQRFLPKTPSSG